MASLKKTGVFVLCTCLLAAVVALPAAAGEKENVTFKNQTADTQYVLVVYGGDGECSDMPERQQLTLEPGDSAEAESGDSDVCWCSSSFGKVGKCGVWTKAKAGKVQKIR